MTKLVDLTRAVEVAKDLRRDHATCDPAGCGLKRLSTDDVLTIVGLMSA